MSDTQHEQHDPTTQEIPAWLSLPQELQGASVKTLAERYFHLSEIKEAGETRVGRHPSGLNDRANVDPDPHVREVLEVGLKAIVREMAALSYELHQRPGGFIALLTGKVDDDEAEERAAP